MHIPAMATCQQCGRTLPVRAQMQVQGASLPMLVVLSQVDSMEAALEQATCQVCLSKTGPADRGLHEVLKALDLKDEEDEVSPPREATVVVHAREDHAVPTVGVVVSDARPREVMVVDPLMGTSIQVTRLALPARQRGRGQRHNDWHQPASEPRVPRALREERPPEPERPVEHFTGKLSKVGDNAAVLEAAMAGIRQRDEERLRERAEKFDKLTHWLKLTLAKIRKRAQAQEVWDLVDTFERKLGEAAGLDARKRGKKGLLAEMGSSSDELESLCLVVYQKPSTWKRKPGTVAEKIDAFEGGRRPESWDVKGGRSPAFYEFEVVRTKSSLPVPNPPLPGDDEDPRPRVVYPDGSGYGPDYTVENSRRLAGVEDEIDAIVEDVVSAFKRWLLANKEELTKLDDDDKPRSFHLGSFLRVFCEDLWEELAAEEAAGQVVDDPPIEAATTVSPDLPATT